VGSRLVRELQALGEPVGCVVRDPSRVDDDGLKRLNDTAPAIGAAGKQAPPTSCWGLEFFARPLQITP
jgi:hypothetical protein